MLKIIASIWAREPSVVVGVLLSALGELVAFHLKITNDQVDAIAKFATTFGPLLALLVVRSQVTPNGSVAAVAAKAVTDSKPPAPPPTPPLVVMMLGALLLLATGCAASLRDGAVSTVNASRELGASAEQVIEALDHQAQEDAKADPAKLAAVRARFHAVFDAYRAYRVAWLAAAAEVRAYDALVVAGGQPSPARLLAALKALADASTALSTAAQTIGGAS